MRNISFFLTEQQFLDGSKDVTRIEFRHGVHSGNRDGIRNAIRGTDKPLISP
jgi:hypothetical protein